MTNLSTTDRQGFYFVGDGFLDVVTAAAEERLVWLQQEHKVMRSKLDAVVGMVARMSGGGNTAAPTSGGGSPQILPGGDTTTTTTTSAPREVQNADQAGVLSAGVVAGIVVATAVAAFLGGVMVASAWTRRHHGIGPGEPGLPVAVARPVSVSESFRDVVLVTTNRVTGEVGLSSPNPLFRGSGGGGVEVDMDVDVAASRAPEP